METNKIRRQKIYDEIIKIFNIEKEKLTIKYPNELDCEFIYQDKKIAIETYSDYPGCPYTYVDLVGNFINEKYVIHQFQYAQLCAYFDNQSYSFTPTEEELIGYLKKFKKYIDENKIFFDFLELDLNKRYFYFTGKIKPLPLIIDLDNEDIYRFGKEEGKRFRRILDKIDKNKKAIIKLI